MNKCEADCQWCPQGFEEIDKVSKQSTECKLWKDRALSAQNIVIDMRDAMLSVLLKHHICPMHWVVDHCPIELYGKNTKLGTEYEKSMLKPRTGEVKNEE